VQLLIKLTQEHGFVDPTSIRDPQAFVSLMQNPTTAEKSSSGRLFGDLYTAVVIFGPSIDFLPALFRHMRTLSVTPTAAASSSSLALSPLMSNIAAWAQINSTNQENDTTKSIDAADADGDDNDDDGQHIVGELDPADCF
jgi:hypothetical protein